MVAYRHATDAQRHRIDWLEEQLELRDRELARLRQRPPPRRRWARVGMVVGMALLGAVGVEVRAAMRSAPWVGGSLRLVDVDGDGRAEPTGQVIAENGPESVVLTPDLDLHDEVDVIPGGGAPEVARVAPPRIEGFHVRFAVLGRHGHIAAFGRRGDQPVVALVADGEVQWVRTLPADVTPDRGLLHARRVIATVPGDVSTKVFAFTLAGDVAWTDERDGIPHRIRGTEGRIYIEHGDQLSALDARDGTVRARR
ncbi:MAG: hypothetical protein AAF928_10985 [Myxococcota bacterium]